MNKNVLILSSSPRRGGNSDRLCDAFLQGCKDAGHTVEKIFLKDKHINYCTGCGICSMYGKPCPQKDDAAEVIEKMIAADVIVMATPVYFYTMSAQMKTLIDRMNPMYPMDYRFRDVYFLATAADEGADVFEKAETGLTGWLDCFPKTTLKGSVYCGRVTGGGEISGNAKLAEARALGAQV